MGVPCLLEIKYIMWE